ncbi:hypothetical protein K439DRAFT_1665860 [Ramaria rubella]|nr:hypothetical protein K439DRAFT_1665860 [Ramaria rubella]
MCVSVVKKTRGNWGAGVLCFNQYCDSINIPEEGRMPAPEILLCLFVANYGAGKVTSECITSWLAGIHRWHQIHDVPWFGDKALSLTIRGSLYRLTTSLSCQTCSGLLSETPRPPVTIQHIECLRNNLDLSNTFDAAVFAVATIAFFGCCQLGELTIPSKHTFDPTYHASRSCKVTRGVARHDRQFMTVHIPWSKTFHSKGDDLHLNDTRTSCSPTTALEHHLSVNQNIPPDAPLFAWSANTGSWEPMTKVWFMSRCKEIFKTHGLECTDGHSFRTGGTIWLGSSS